MISVNWGSDLEQIAVTVAAAGVLGVIAWLFRLGRRLDKQDADIAAVKGDVADIKSSLERQFGGNGGGIREAVNGISKRLDDHIDLHKERGH